MKKLLFLLMLALCLITACKPKIPGEYIQPSEMEAVLYDYHQTLEVMTEQDLPYDTLLSRACLEAVLRKHGISSEQYEISMNYYTRHTMFLRDIYEGVSNRFSAKAMSLGAFENDLDALASNSVTGDTANIWTGDRAMVLMQYPTNQVYSFFYAADTTYRAGDAFSLRVDTKFLFQDGVRDGIIVLALKLANDSVISRVVHMGSSNQYRAELRDEKRIGIKQVKGYFLLNQNKNLNTDSRTTMKLMVLNKIVLLRMHQKEVKPVAVEQAANADSIQTADTIKTPQPVLKPKVTNGSTGLTRPIGGPYKDSGLKKSGSLEVKKVKIVEPVQEIKPKK